ncbi:MAG TPA: Ldh family oxidoreductase [Bacillota bacterium]|nr:Ldh family oxidoreductase [Bacillota bacterium]HNT03006.1 Ldh family oxidoreductase [Bacillota bacterium]HOH89169.1 Ldh family oxidoreductase [Bacillota bacterium]HPA55660.1 Ldh family oxidoreductase [Bacillota bacterium]HPM00189.1 Ldh family oxidoreductase [Bacillota bacterium]
MTVWCPALIRRRKDYTGGYDKDGNLTDDPNAIFDGGEVLPSGYWRGSGFSIVIDMVVSALSVGKSTYDMGMNKNDKGVSQVFIAINPIAYAGENHADAYIENMSQYIKTSAKKAGVTDILYPGEKAARERIENMRENIPVNKEMWETLLKL